jgi:hypothetical protein
VVVTKIGSYTVLGVLGEGGMGRVYLGRTDKARRPAAVVPVAVLVAALTVTGDDRGDFLCHGDTVFGSGPTLDYGQAIRVGGTACTSRESGVECRVDATRHGFSISRTRYTLF